MSEEVERWLERRTFHHERFADIGRLVRLKREKRMTVSVCLPTMNEAETIGEVLRVFRENLVEEHPLIDELAIIDSRSSDGTVDIALKEGARVLFDDEILPGIPPASGKGEALWKSLFALEGDIIAWVDADIVNIHPRFAYGLVGPLLEDPGIGYVKAFYERPILQGDSYRPSGGGRVTELTVRPVLGLFYPELSGLIQPLSGEYAARRSVLESMPFLTGYGVETGMLLEVRERFGLDALAQVDMEVRKHRNQPLGSLSKMSFGILQALFRRLEADGRISINTPPSTVYNTVRREGEGYAIEPSYIDLAERPPMNTVPEYRNRGSLDEEQDG